MFARIYRPSRSAMQSGKGKFDAWVLEFEREGVQRVDPLMGWTSGSDTLASQVRLTFETKDEAVAYAKREGLPHQVIEPAKSEPTAKSYADNFITDRRAPWTH